MTFRHFFRQGAGWYLVLAMLVMPWLGVVHTLVHGTQDSVISHAGHSRFSADLGVTSALAQRQPLQGSANRPVAERAVLTGATESTDGSDLTQSTAPWAQALFSGHGSEADCQLFDQFCQAQALHVLTSEILPTQSTALVLATLAGDVIARWAAFFQARAPPLAR